METYHSPEKYDWFVALRYDGDWEKEGDVALRGHGNEWLASTSSIWTLPRTPLRSAFVMQFAGDTMQCIDAK